MEKDLSRTMCCLAPLAYLTCRSVGQLYALRFSPSTLCSKAPSISSFLPRAALEKRAPMAPRQLASLSQHASESSRKLRVSSNRASRWSASLLLRQ